LSREQQSRASESITAVRADDDSSLGFELSNDEHAALVAFEAQLHREGWAEFVSVARALNGWDELSRTLNRYEATIDDYTNDLYDREVLDLALKSLPAQLREKLAAAIDPIDERFRQASVADTDHQLGRFHRIDDMPGWWWRRIPSEGPLADYLAAAAGRGGSGSAS
jgi:hypothetical protein